MATNKVDWEEIQTTATNIEKYNDQIYDLLKEALGEIHAIVPDPWSGEAADAAQNSFEAFDKRYRERYHELLEEYVAFLRDTAAGGHSDTEGEIKSISNEIMDLIG